MYKIIDPIQVFVESEGQRGWRQESDESATGATTGFTKKAQDL